MELLKGIYKIDYLWMVNMLKNNLLDLSIIKLFFLLYCLFIYISLHRLTPLTFGHQTFFEMLEFKALWLQLRFDFSHNQALSLDKSRS